MIELWINPVTSRMSNRLTYSQESIVKHYSVLIKNG